MSDELKDFTVTPTLTFEPLKEEASCGGGKERRTQGP